MLIRDAEVEGARRSVRVEGERIVEFAPRLSARPGEPCVDAQGGALLPGLHDHHLHLYAWAAAERSVACVPPDVQDAGALRRALRAAPPRDGWIRGVGYHESVAGELDRHALDAFALAHPLRLQHRGGALWMLDSRAVAALGLDAGNDAPGVERDASGRATGRLFGLDAWLRERLPARPRPSLAGIGQQLSAWGVCGVTDATATNGTEAMRAVSRAQAEGELRQRVLLMGSEALAAFDPAPRLARGALKIVLDEARLPDFDALVARVAEAHAEARPVAVHCVTRAELVLCLAAFAEAGSLEGDRIEHAAVAPDEVLAGFAHTPLRVVTQPAFVHQRGDAYRSDVASEDQPWLYRCQGLLSREIPLAGSTDAPFGPADPWAAMRAAVDRRTACGVALGSEEALSPEQARDLFLSPLEAPGAAPRRIEVGAAADLCLLADPWARARDELCATRVRASWCGGALVHGA